MVWALRGAHFFSLKEARDEECRCLREYHPICLWLYSRRMIPAEGVYKKQTNHEKQTLKVIKIINYSMEKAGRRRRQKMLFCRHWDFQRLPRNSSTGSSEKLLVVIRWFLHPESHHWPGTWGRCGRSHDRQKCMPLWKDLTSGEKEGTGPLALQFSESTWGSTRLLPRKIDPYFAVQNN